MIGFLRFVGLMNAAAWFGAAVFFSLGAAPAMSSAQLRELIGANNFPYYSEAIGYILAGRFFALYTICSVLALLYLMGEWLYFGKYPRKRWLAFVSALVLAGLARGYWVQPNLKGLHELAHGRTTPVEQRQTVTRAFRTWAVIARSLDILLVAGLGIYVWRVGNPTEPTRFLTPNKFRS